MAADSPTPGTETCACRHSLLLHDGGEACTAPGCPCAWFYKGRPDFAAPSPVDTTEPPAETQQDDERDWQLRDRMVQAAYRNGWRAALAARPSADTETLRRAIAAAEQRGYERAQNECPPGGWESGL